MNVRLIGVDPKKTPTEPREGWYRLEVGPGCTVAGVLSRFGLDAEGLSVLKNGSHVGPDDRVESRDELQVFLKSLGG